MNDFFTEHWVTIVWTVVGMTVCLAGGLLSLTPDPENPKKFIPTYIAAMMIFLIGIAMILRRGETVSDLVAIRDAFQRVFGIA